MTKKRLQKCFAHLSTSCSFSASTANISSAKMSSDKEGIVHPTRVFSLDEMFYGIADLSNAPDDTIVKAMWIAVDVEGVDPNTKIDTTKTTSGSGQPRFNLTNDGSWPLGNYKVGRSASRARLLPLLLAST